MSNTASNEIVVVIGPGQIGQAIARRVGFGKHVLLAENGRRVRMPRRKSSPTRATM